MPASPPPSLLPHPRFSRRMALQVGTIGLLGLSTAGLGRVRAASAGPAPRARTVVYLFLSGGLGQHDSFDMKPDAAAEIRGEFRPIDTATPGLQVCEHLPLLAQRSQHWVLVRSLGHHSNDHSAGHHIMLTGRSELPQGFNPNQPRPGDWPSIAAVVGSAVAAPNALPPAIVLPDRLVHNTGRILPGQFGGLMGRRRDPWFIESSPFAPTSYGAFPEYEFDHQDRPGRTHRCRFEPPSLTLPEDLAGRFDQRLALLEQIDSQRARLDAAASDSQFDSHRQAAASLLTDPKVRRAFDLKDATDAELDRYGRNSFGWSLLMTRRLVEAGVPLLQVNLGNNETWDTHGNAFPHLKENLFPPTDRALSALLDDLHGSGLLDTTLLVMAGEFGRTPKISHLPQHYKLPGRDHWGAAQTVWLAGGGVRGGTVIGSTDRIGAYPASAPQTPENLAATIYQALGIPGDAQWRDPLGRPFPVYHAGPIAGLT